MAKTTKGGVPIWSNCQNLNRRQKSIGPVIGMWYNNTVLLSEKFGAGELETACKSGVVRERQSLPKLIEKG